MTVFKTFLKVLNKSKGIVLLYTFILLLFAVTNMANQEETGDFVSSKPDVFVVLQDENVGLTKNLMDYLRERTVMKEVLEENLPDALFYRDVNMIIQIPEGYRIDILNGKTPDIVIQSTGDYQASLANMLLEKYLRVQSIYQTFDLSEEELMGKINETLSNEVSLEMTTTLDTEGLSKAKFYYNFSNYAILAGLVYVVCLLLSVFREKTVLKRTMVSSMNLKKYQRILFLSNGLFAIFLWALYVFISFLLVGNVLFSFPGVLFVLQSFLFTLCALSIAFFIGSICSNKEAISGIVNVVALGFSFLCGAFVPTEFLPESVLTVAHIFPSYWFIHGNELISSLETFDFLSLKPLFFSMGMLLFFTILFVFLTRLVSKRKISE